MLPAFEAVVDVVIDCEWVVVVRVWAADDDDVIWGLADDDDKVWWAADDDVVMRSVADDDDADAFGAANDDDVMCVVADDDDVEVFGAADDDVDVVCVGWVVMEVMDAEVRGILDFCCCPFLSELEAPDPELSSMFTEF